MLQGGDQAATAKPLVLRPALREPAARPLATRPRLEQPIHRRPSQRRQSRRQRISRLQRHRRLIPVLSLRKPQEMGRRSNDGRDGLARFEDFVAA